MVQVKVEIKFDENGSGGIWIENEHDEPTVPETAVGELVVELVGKFLSSLPGYEGSVDLTPPDSDSGQDGD